jgi:hypothetical protein
MPRRATVLLAMAAGAAAMTVGGGLSLALAMLSARDLSRIPAMPGAGIIGNFGVPEDAVDRAWRRFAPRAWQAWPDGGGSPYEATRGDGVEVGLLVGSGWSATVVASRGLYDLVWIDRFAPGSEAAGDARDELWRLADAEPVVEAPAWIPADLPRACEGALPGRTRAAGAVFREAIVGDGAWMALRPRRDAADGGGDADPIDGVRAEEGRVGELRTADLKLEEIRFDEIRVDEVRAFGWPFRAFVVTGAAKRRTVTRDGWNTEWEALDWWTDGLGVEPADGWGIRAFGVGSEVDEQPAKGLPWKPRWPALFANAAILGLPPVALPIVLVLVARAALARVRRARHRCPACGHAREGLPSDARCPECGAV